jgi:hypothetical protein
MESIDIADFERLAGVGARDLTPDHVRPRA